MQLRVGENSEWTLLDILTVFSVILQVVGYQNDIKQSSNDDLMSELRRQDEEYLKRIVQNQNRILSILGAEPMSTEK